MSTTPTTRPPEGHRTRLAPRGDIARYLVSRAPVPLGSFGAFINDADRDVGYQQLVTRLTADEPDPWSRAREDDVNERLRASLSTDQDRELFRQLGNHSADKAAIREAAAYLVGLEVGRQSETPIWRQPEARNLKPEAESPSTTGRSVEDVMLKVVSALWLAKFVADNQLADIGEIKPDAWFALSDLLETAARDLDEAHGRYCTEHNALVAAATSGGAR